MMKAIIYYDYAYRRNTKSKSGYKWGRELKTVIFTDKIVAMRETHDQIFIDTVDRSYGITESDKKDIMDKITEFILSDTAPNILEINKPEQDNESVVDNDPPITS